jgi:hypothetical protein
VEISHPQQHPKELRQAQVTVALELLHLLLGHLWPVRVVAVVVLFLQQMGGIQLLELETMAAEMVVKTQLLLVLGP